MKPSTYYFHLKTKILADLQMCISPPLKDLPANIVVSEILLQQVELAFSWKESFISFCMKYFDMSNSCLIQLFLISENCRQKVLLAIVKWMILSEVDIFKWIFFDIFNSRRCEAIRTPTQLYIYIYIYLMAAGPSFTRLVSPFINS